MRPQSVFAVFLVLIPLWLLPLSGQAVEQALPLHKRLIHEADAIFVGRVVRVDYRYAADSGLPHTAVTYEVEQVLGGRINSKIFTVRYLGGPNSTDPKKMTHILNPPETPACDVGNRDVIFVKDNGIVICPLALESQGRFRLVDGHVYTEDGLEVFLDRGQIRFGKARHLPELDTHQVLGVTLHRDGAEKRKLGTVTSTLGVTVLTPDQAVQSQSVSERDFIEFLTSQIQTTPLSGKQALSVDVNASFNRPLPTPTRGVRPWYTHTIHNNVARTVR